MKLPLSLKRQMTPAQERELRPQNLCFDIYQTV